jgi:hypothetical protein
MRHFKELFLLCASLLPQLGHGQPDLDARTFVEKYSKSMLKGDVHSMVEAMSPVLIAKIGGTPEAEQWLQTQVDDLRQENLFPLAETIGEFRAYSDPSILLYFVRSTRFSDGFPNRIPNPYLYLVYTTDQGKNWKILDLACANLKWLHAIAPGFHDDASVSDLLSE